MLKRYIWLMVATVFFVFQMLAGSATAARINEATRTVKLNEQGDTVVLTPQQVEDGQRLFNFACAQCHAGGVTKTNPNIDLKPETLALATPPRDSIEGLVDYMKNPTTYDGEESIAELHPSLKSADVYPKMRNLTEDDLVAIAGHTLFQPKVVGDRWGAGKTGF
ncbi:MAG TPA: photosystem II cytochrome c-550 [Candidatus Caenarcaniphilales bacterium]